MKPTIKDVANKAGVSISTTSRVLNGSGYASEKTKKRVLDAAAEISFNANYFARGLRGKTPGIIGLINKDYLHPFFSLLSHGIEEEARKHNVGIISVCSKGDSARERACIDMLLDRNVKQMVFATATDIDNIIYAKNLGVHCIVIERDLGYTQVDRIMYNNVAAGSLIANVFHRAGFKSVGYIGMNTAIGSIEHDRYHGYKHAVAELHMNMRMEWDIHTCKEYKSDYGYEACKKIFENSSSEGPEALMIGSDYLLVGVIDYLHEHKISIPKDVSLMSADNFYTDIVFPRIDSIDYSLSELGKEAIGLILENTDQDTKKGENMKYLYRTMVINPVYVQRKSVLGA